MRIQNRIADKNSSSTLPLSYKGERLRSKIQIEDKENLLSRLYRAFEDVSDERKQELVDLCEEFARSIVKQPPPLPKMGSGYLTYDAWKIIHKSRDGRECLRQNWGIWLMAFNPNLDQDYMSQADLGKLDRKLLTRLKTQYSGEELNAFLPSLSNYHTQKVKNITINEKKEMYRTAFLIHRRSNPTSALK